MARSVFYGFGAFVGSFSSPTACRFWPDDPTKIGWTTPTVPVDLAMNPDAVRRGTIPQTALQIDDHISAGTGGQTRIGPLFPGGAMIGLAYLEEGYMTAQGLTAPGPRTYEWCTIQYWASDPAPLTNRRFHGFHAEIHSLTGTTAMVSLWARGTSTVSGQLPMGTWAIDLAVWAHPVGPGATQISAAGQAGALFIDQRAGSGGVIAFDSPKSPRILGGITAPRGRRDR